MVPTCSSQDLEGQGPESFNKVLDRFVRLSESSPASLEHVSLWNSDAFRNWFSERGYTLYVLVPTDEPDIDAYDVCYPVSLKDAKPESPPAAGTQLQIDEYPYAYYSSVNTNGLPPLATWLDSKAIVFFAENRDGKHVAIKLVQDNTEEYKVLKLLHEERHKDCSEQRSVIPVIDMLPAKGYWFCVMPRWGTFTPLNAFTTVKQALDCLRNVLEGLSFLHERRIFHGDLKPESILLNHFDNDNSNQYSSARMTLLINGRLKYALFGFSHSIVFPLKRAIKDCRLPRTESWRGTTGSFPNDASQGELEFNPFAWDVCALGLTAGVLCDPLIPMVPMLAPLLDRMISRDVEKRFTAAEALRFFQNEVLPRTPQELLEERYPMDYYPGYCDPDRDRWQDLDPLFVQEWVDYRQPPLPLSIRLLRYLCSFRLLSNLVVVARRIHRGDWRVLFRSLKLVTEETS